MPKRQKSRNPIRHFGDVTINDYANSTVSKNRIKKSAINVTTVIQQESEKSWEEKADWDLVKVEDEEGNVSFICKESTKKTKRKPLSDQPDNRTGKDYPLDIWFLLSEYIRPEDVQSFACICKSSYAVVCSAKFWFCLYKRFYKNVNALPERLQKQCIQRFYGLRAAVICALHYMYPPFVHKFLKDPAFDQSSNTLLKRQCVLMWHEQRTNHWIYYFKMREKCERTIPHRDASEVDLLEMLEDVNANPEENCRVLKITCTDFVALPLVIGHVLTFACLKLSNNYSYYRMQLHFTSGVANYHRREMTSNGSTLILDPVVRLRILDWWHPLYPRNYDLEQLLNRD